MGKWQPPIPAGALSSKPARKIGLALALLAYCYDLVERDGWFDIVIKDAADDMQEPYQKVKRWWIVLRSGPFFCDQIDRGKLGWRMRFKDPWLDWRVLNARPADDTFSSTDEVSKSVLDQNEVPMKYKSSTNQVSKSVLHQNVYGTHDPDQADHDPPPPTQPPRESGGGGGFDPEAARLFASYGIYEAEPLARFYRDAFPQVTLAELRDLCARLYEPDAGKHAPSRLLRLLRTGPTTAPPKTATSGLSLETYQPPPRLIALDPERARRIFGKEVRDAS